MRMKRRINERLCVALTIVLAFLLFSCRAQEELPEETKPLATETAGQTTVLPEETTVPPEETMVPTEEAEGTEMPSESPETISAPSEQAPAEAASPLTLLLPSVIQLSEDMESACRFELKAGGIGERTAVVTVTSQNDFAVVCGEDSLSYVLMAGESGVPLQNGSIVARFTSDGAVTLEAALSEAPSRKGRYQDVLTFTVRIEGGEKDE